MEVVMHRLCSSKTLDGSLKYFIGCQKDKEHSLDDFSSFTKFHKRVTCMKCLNDIEHRIWYPNRKILMGQINGMKDFKRFLVKNSLLTKFVTNCLKQDVKSILYDIEGSVFHSFDWDNTDEGPDFWYKAECNWTDEVWK